MSYYKNVLYKFASFTTAGFPYVNLKQDSTGAWVWQGTNFIHGDMTDTFWRDNHPLAGKDCLYLRKLDGFKLSTFDCDPEVLMCLVRTI